MESMYKELAEYNAELIVRCNKLKKMLDCVVAENELLKRSVAENNPFEELYQYIQQISYKEIHAMQITGNTRASNVCNQILQRMESEYGVGKIKLF